MADRFVSEKDLAEQKQRRQEEWEKVRKPEDAQEAPEPEVDNRSLYDRLKEQRDKAQLEKDESKAFKNTVRGLDTEEIGFLDFVDNMKNAEERRKTQEEKQLLEEVKKLREETGLVQQEAATKLLVEKKVTPPKLANKQAQLLAGAIKRKSDDGGGCAPVIASKRPVPTDRADCSESLRPTAMKTVGILPGLANYSSDDDSSADSDTDDEDLSTGLLPQKAHVEQKSAYSCEEKSHSSGSREKRSDHNSS